MAPIVHGLERQYSNEIDFVFLDVSDPVTRAARERFGFETTPHFFLLAADGRVLREHVGRIPREELERWIVTAVADAS